MVLGRVWALFSAIYHKVLLFFAGSLKIPSRMVRILIVGVGPYCLLFVPKFCCFLLVVLRLSSRMLRLMIARVWNLLSAICPKVSVFFAISFKVALQNATNNNTQGLSPILCDLSQSFFFFSVVLRLASRKLRTVIARVWTLLTAIFLKV